MPSKEIHFAPIKHTKRPLKNSVILDMTAFLRCLKSLKDLLKIYKDIKELRLSSYHSKKFKFKRPNLLAAC